MELYKHSELTGKIIGCAMDVHKKIGAGFQEVIYKRSLQIELERCGLSYETEVEKEIFYDDVRVGARRLDILVEKLVIVELKAVTIMEPIFYVQTVNYLKVFNIEIGLLLNFGNKSLEIKRLAN